MAAGRRFRSAIVIAALTFALAELTLRAAPYAVGEPLRSLLLESRRIPLSSARTYGGTRVLLPPAADADLVVVGDSFPFGSYVRAADAFPAVLARQSGRTVINLAVGSQAPVTYQRMVELAAAYRPELVVYCLFANDFAHRAEPRALDLDAPFGARPEDDLLYVRDVTPGVRARQLARRVSNLSQVNLLRKLLAQPTAEHQAVRWQHGAMSYLFASAAYWDPQIDWDTPSVQRATALNAAFVGEARRGLEARGIRLAVVLIPSKEMVHGPAAGDSIYRDGHHRTYRELAARLATAGTTVVDLTDGLRRRAAAGQQLYFTIDGHWNEAGHRAAAEILAERGVAEAGMMGTSGRP